MVSHQQTADWKERGVNSTANFIIKYRWLIIIGFITFVILFALQIPQVEIDADMKSQLPENLESRLNTEMIDELFGGTEMIMVLVKTDDVLERETLERVKNISKQINRLKGVDKVLSLFDLKADTVNRFDRSNFSLDDDSAGDREMFY